MLEKEEKRGGAKSPPPPEKGKEKCEEKGVGGFRPPLPAKSIKSLKTGAEMIAYMRDAKKPSYGAQLPKISLNVKRGRSQKGACFKKGPPSTLSKSGIKCDNIGAKKVICSQTFIRDYMVSQDHSSDRNHTTQTHSKNNLEEGKDESNSKLKCQELWDRMSTRKIL